MNKYYETDEESDVDSREESEGEVERMYLLEYLQDLESSNGNYIEGNEVPVSISSDSDEKDIRTPEKECNDDSNEKNATAFPKGIQKLIENLKDLLMNGQHSDVTLKVEDREFKVHRAILGVRSPVFASMLKHDMVEKNSGVIQISDSSAEAFEEFLLYLYTGNADILSPENVVYLYQSGDYYYIDDLKSECVDFMKKCWTVDTFCDVFALSLRYNETELIKLANQFFTQNLKKILKTVQWQLFLKENPTAANELYIKAIECIIPEEEGLKNNFN